MSQERAVRIRIHGRVQGVFFRAWTVEEATRRGLAGWVRNRADGSVEALLVGPAVKIEEMIAACRRGPPAAQVARIAVEEAGPGEADLLGRSFRQLPTV